MNFKKNKKLLLFLILLFFILVPFLSSVGKFLSASALAEMVNSTERNSGYAGDKDEEPLKVQPQLFLPLRRVNPESDAQFDASTTDDTD